MLRWKEPASFKRALAREQGVQPNPWYPFLFMIGIMAVCLGGVAYHNNPWLGSWLLTVVLAAVAGFLIAYGVPFFASLDPNLIVITERGVGRRVLQGGSVRLECWPWEEIESCQLDSITLEGNTYSVLAVHSYEGELALFALGPKVEIKDLKNALETQGKQLLS